jgi:hypothetical protein
MPGTEWNDIQHQSLDVDEQIALEDEFPFLVFLVSLVGTILDIRLSDSSLQCCERNDKVTYVFPTKYSLTLDAIYITNGMVACRHLTINGFTLDDIDAGTRESGWVSMRRSKTARE